MKYIHTVAIYLIVLVLTIPFYIADVFAELNDVRAKGSDNIYGYMRIDDNATFEARANITGDSLITSSQLKLGTQTGFNCTGSVFGLNNFECYVEKFISGVSTYILFTINLYNDTGTLEDSVTRNITVDNKAPAVTLFSISPASTNTGTVDLVYNIQDYAYTTSDITLCSGVKRVEFYNDSSGTNLVAYDNLYLSNCTVTGSKQYTSSISTGTETVCIKAIDNFDQASAITSCQSFEVDVVGPVIDSNSLIIKDSNGDELNYFSDVVSAAIVYVNITGDDLDKNSVTADLTPLNTNLPVGYEAMQATCGGTVNSVTTCYWEISVRIAEGGAKIIEVNASDDAANNNSVNINKDVGYDNTGPTATSIKTGEVASGVSYIRATNNTFIATFDESQSGLGADDITLYLKTSAGGLEGSVSDIGNYKAANCTTSSVCYWYGLDVNSADGNITMSIGTDSTDKLGNPVPQEYSFSAVYDSTAPQLTNLNVSPLYPTSLETLDITFSVADNSPTEVLASAMTISSEAFPKTVSCSGGAGNYSCSVSISSLNSQYTEGKLYLQAEDAAGNKLLSITDVIIYEATNETPNVFSVDSIETMPGKVDRRAASQVNVKLFVHPTLTSSAGANLLSQRVDCTEMGSDITGTPYLLNIGTSPYIALNLNKISSSDDDSDEVGNIDIKCKLYLKIQYGQKVYLNEEAEPIETEVELYNIALGEIGQAAQDKVNSIKGDISGLEGKIESLEQWNEIIGLICGIAEMLTNIDILLQAIKSVVYGIAVVIAAIPVIGPVIANKIWLAVCWPISTYHKILQFIWPTGLAGVISVLKVFCFLYTCRLCDFGEWMNVGLGAAFEAMGDWGSVELEREQGPISGEGELSLDNLIYGLEEYYVEEYGAEDYELDYDSEIEGEVIADTPQITGAAESLTSMAKSRWEDLPGDTSSTGRIKSPIDSGQWLYNPYKSIHYAKACLCVPGMIYNYKKLRQIKCMEIKCIEENSKEGLPITSCENAFKERECLYYTSAAYELHGFGGNVLERLADIIINSLPGLILGIAHFLVCNTAGVACGELITTGWLNVGCGISGAAITLMDWEDITENAKFNDYDYDIGADQCSGIA